jgi:hypothetical protein
MHLRFFVKATEAIEVAQFCRPPIPKSRKNRAHNQAQTIKDIFAKASRRVAKTSHV